MTCLRESDTSQQSHWYVKSYSNLVVFLLELEGGRVPQHSSVGLRTGGECLWHVHTAFITVFTVIILSCEFWLISGFYFLNSCLK